MNAASIIGSLAAFCIVFGYLPQTIRTVKTRSTDDLASTTFLLMMIGGALFLVQGVLTNNIPLVVTNALTTTMSTIIFSIKLVNDCRKAKLRKNKK